ncbi:MAG: HSP90 family protein [Verrucomicrobiales bacterium]|nr:HSP90 family protein [Verrucomicrobiales bacterium]
MESNFQVNLEGVIKLLSDHLYSGPEVYLRELMQNAVDAVTARKIKQPGHPGRIRIEVLPSSAGSAPTLVVEDDGIGLTEAEVHEFLATIGQSSKKGDFSRKGFIGQFGIGLLSGFVVSDEITVITKSLADDSTPVEWKGQVDGTYSVRILDRQIAPGSRVYLRAKTGSEEYFEPETVEKLLRHYGCHLPCEISLTTGGGEKLLNEAAPWENPEIPHEQKKEKYLNYGREVFETDFLDAIPLESEAGQIQGVAFILPYTASAVSRQSHRVYLKNMLLAENAEGLLPEWAFFVKCVVNANDLRPNAAREAFHEDDALAKARDHLGESIKNYMVKLAATDRKRLDAIIALHFLPMKALAVEDDEFFKLFIDWLPFESSLGRTTLGDHFRGDKSLNYVRSHDQFRQVASVANAQQMCVFNGGYTYDSELFERMADVIPGRIVERVDVTDLVLNFDELSLDEKEAVFCLVKLADAVLKPYECSAIARNFEPDELPTLYTANDNAAFLRTIDNAREETDELWSGILDSVAETRSMDAYSRLVLNYRNSLIRRLAAMADDTLVARIIELLYLQSLLLGHYPLRSGELEILGNGLLGLINHFLNENSNG